MLILLLPMGANAQTDTTKAKKLSLITKNDGTEYIGEILSDDGREILIMTEKLGKIYIPKSSIQSIVAIESDSEIVHGEYRSTGPFTTRYAFTTNALPIKKGENYAIINLYGPEVHFAISDNFNLGVMSTWIASPFVLAAKYTFDTQSETFNVSLGTLFGTSGYLNNFRGFGGLHFINFTGGTREKNITFSAGYCYLQAGFTWGGGLPDEGTYITQSSYFDSWAYSNGRRPMVHGPMASLAGMVQVGKKATFIFDSMVGYFPRTTYSASTTELSAPYNDPNPPYNYIPGSYEHVITHTRSDEVAMFLMPGMRFQSQPNRAFQVSLAGVTYFRNGSVLAFPMPMLSWYFKF